MAATLLSADIFIMDLNEEKACVAIITAILLKRRVKRRIWVKQWYRNRGKYTHLNLLDEIRLTGEMDDYKNYFRMSDKCFDNLLELVTPFLIKQDTEMRQAITPREKLALTLHFLGTGQYFNDIRFAGIMSPESVSQSIILTCEALMYILQDYIKMPATADKWREIANDFGTINRFYNCLGALDGKHIRIRHPHNSGSLYFNYKQYYSIVLMAMVNANKEFVMIDVGSNGRVSDGGVLFYTNFWELFNNNNLNLPDPSPLPNTTECFPFIIVGDEAFALKPSLMKPYSQKSATIQQQIFNKRLSSARSAVECAFGIMATKFGVFHKAMCLNPEKASKITAACCYLHNYLIKKEPQIYLRQNSDNNAIQLLELQRTNNRNASTNAKAIRDRYCHYYNNEGKFN